jgi:hypothetical protein
MSFCMWRDWLCEVLKLGFTPVEKDGGYIAASAHAIPGDAKPENVAAMIEILRRQ